MSADAGSASLADRISKPDTTTSGSSWADEVNSPSVTDNPNPIDAKIAPEPSTAVEDEKQKSASQMDGATEPFGGSELQEPDYQVEIKLADMQADPNHPLYSATSFEQLGLYEKDDQRQRQDIS